MFKVKKGELNESNVGGFFESGYMQALITIKQIALTNGLDYEKAFEETWKDFLDD